MLNEETDAFMRLPLLVRPLVLLKKSLRWIKLLSKTLSSLNQGWSSASLAVGLCVGS